MSTQYNPAKIYENQLDGVISNKLLFGSDAAGANHSAVSAVTGKRIKILSGVFMTNNAAGGQVGFYSSSTAGTLLLYTNTPPIGAAPLILPFNPCGWFETNTGEALVSRGFTQEQDWTINYIIYTP